MNLRKLAVVAIAGLAVFATVGSGEDEAGTATTVASGDSADSAGASASSGNATEGEATELDDVEITSCAVDSTTSWPKAELKITNNSSKTSDYFIEITFESPDASQNFGTGSTIVQNLAAGQTKNDVAQGLDEATGEITCKVTSVDRTESL